MGSITNEISNSLNQIETLDPTTFTFNFPPTDLPEINYNELFKPPTDTNTGSASPQRFLDKKQLTELRQLAKFKVKSGYEGQYHVWGVSKLLQTGSLNIKESLLDGLSQCSFLLLLDIPDKIFGQNLSIRSGLKSMVLGTVSILKFLLGSKSIDKKNEEGSIKTELQKYLRSQLDDNSVPRLAKYQSIIKNLMPAYQTFWKKWNIDKNDRRDQLYQKFGSEEQIAKAEEQIWQCKMLELFAANLPPPDADLLGNFFKSVILVRSKVRAYDQSKKIASERHLAELKSKHCIMSRIPSWTKNRLDLHEKIWSEENSKKLEDNLSLELVAEQKNIFDLYLRITQSDSYLEFSQIMREETVPVILEYAFRIWNHNRWEVKEIDGKYYSVESTRIEMPADYLGWKIVDLMLRANLSFNNANCHFFSQIFYGKFGLRSLYGCGTYCREWIVDYDTGDFKPKIGSQHLTLWAKFKELFGSIGDARNHFESGPDTGILGKNLSRVFDMIWNYGVRGIGGALAMGIYHPLLVSLNVIFSTGFIVSSPIWSILLAILGYLWEIFIYDLHSKDFRFFPLFRIFYLNFVANGLYQIVLSILAISWKLPAGLLVGLGSLLRALAAYIYDFCMYHLLLKYLARIPASNGLLVKRIAGPGISPTYYLIGPNLALTILKLKIEDIHQIYYRKSTQKLILTPKQKLLDFYQQFSSVGLVPNFRSEPLVTFTKNEEYLQLKLDSVPHKWTDIKFKDQIRSKGKDLLVGLDKGSTMCSVFIPKIFQTMDPLYAKEFWSGQGLKENDWNGLVLSLYTEIFSPNFLEEIDPVTNFCLGVEDESYEFIHDLIPKPLPNLHVPEVHSGRIETNLVTLENIFGSGEYEQMMTFV